MFTLTTSPFADGGNGAEAIIAEAGAEAAEALNGAAAAPPPGGFGFDTMTMLLIYAAIIAFFYFVVIRPQRTRDKKIKEMQATLKVGDNIVTTGGMFGRISDVGHDCFMVEFGINKGVRIPIRKSDVLGVQSPQLTPPPDAEGKS